MAKLWWVIAFLAVVVSVAGAAKRGEVQAPAPPPGADCSVLVYDMLDCLSFISVGGSDEKPSKSCCSGFKKVVKTDSDCVCEALKSSGRWGINLNMTRAMALPPACGASSSFSLSTCDVSAAPGSAPAPAPFPDSATVPAPAPEPESSPAPSPDIVGPPTPAAPVVEPPAVSPWNNNGGESPGFEPESGTPSASGANPRLLVFCIVALAAAAFYFV